MMQIGYQASDLVQYLPGLEESLEERLFEERDFGDILAPLFDTVVDAFVRSVRRNPSLYGARKLWNEDAESSYQYEVEMMTGETVHIAVLFIVIPANRERRKLRIADRIFFFSETTSFDQLQEFCRFFDIFIETLSLEKMRRVSAGKLCRNGVKHLEEKHIRFYWNQTDV